MKRKCYSFENSGHRFEVLDVFGGVVMRLYCPRCSRVVSTAIEHNIEGWDVDTLPDYSKVDYMTNFGARPLVIRKES